LKTGVVVLLLAITIAGIGAVLFFSSYPNQQVFPGKDHNDGVLREGVFQRCFDANESRPEFLYFTTWKYSTSSYLPMGYRGYLVTNNSSLTDNEELVVRGAGRAGTHDKLKIVEGEITQYEKASPYLGSKSDLEEYNHRSIISIPDENHFCLSIWVVGGKTSMVENITTGWEKLADLHIEYFDYQVNQGNLTWDRRISVGDNGVVGFPDNLGNVTYLFTTSEYTPGCIERLNTSGSSDQYCSPNYDKFEGGELYTGVFYHSTNNHPTLIDLNHSGDWRPYVVWYDSNQCAEGRCTGEALSDINYLENNPFMIALIISSLSVTTFVGLIVIDQPSRVGLFSRISKLAFIGIVGKSETAKGREIRMVIEEFILNHPGTFYNEIVGLLGLGMGQASYHLHKLETFGLIWSQRFGRRLCYFSSTIPKSGEAVDDILLLCEMKEIDRSIIQFTRESGPIESRQVDLAKLLNVSQPTISRSLERLEGWKLIELESVNSHFFRLGLSEQGNSFVKFLNPIN